MMFLPEKKVWFVDMASRKLMSSCSSVSRTLIYSSTEAISNDQNPNDPNRLAHLSAYKQHGNRLFLSLRHSGFGLVSDFDIRISDLTVTALHGTTTET